MKSTTIVLNKLFTYHGHIKKLFSGYNESATVENDLKEAAKYVKIIISNKENNIILKYILLYIHKSDYICDVVRMVGLQIVSLSA